MPALYERYRPRRWEDVIGQDKAVATVRRVIERPTFDGGAFYIFGPSGTGKTTIAQLIGAQFADDFGVEELDGDACTVDAVRELGQNIRINRIGNTWRVIIVNEAHAMTPRAVQAWLTLLERCEREITKRVFVFTSTEELQPDLFGGFGHAFASRCKMIGLTSKNDHNAIAARLREVAQAEGLDGQPVERYKRLISTGCKGNWRAAYQAIEAGELLA